MDFAYWYQRNIIFFLILQLKDYYGKKSLFFCQLHVLHVVLLHDLFRMGTVIFLRERHFIFG